MGELISHTIVENQEYLLTIVVDSDYLCDEDTVYPIRIDPTVEICYDNNGSNAISDVTLNSNTDSSGTSGSLSVGLRETYGISRILMKFPGLNLASLGKNIEINSATVEIRDLMCESTELDVSCYVFSGNAWDESTVAWANANPNSISTFLSSNIISYANGKQQATAHRYAFDITEAVRGWKTGNYDPNKGIIFKGPASVESGTTYNCKTIASYNRSSNKPSLSITYSTTSNLFDYDTYFYLNNKYCGDYLKYTPTYASVGSGLLYTFGDSIMWEIMAVNGGYVIRAKSDTTKYLAVSLNTNSSDISVVTVSDSMIPTYCIWDISVASGGGCLIQNKYNSRYLYSYGEDVRTESIVGVSGSRLYESKVWRIAGMSYYGDSESFEKRELSASTRIKNIEESPNATVPIKVEPFYDNELWTSPTDFTYSFHTSGFVTYFNGKITLSDKIGGTKVTATHKVTDRKKTFYIIVGFSTTIDSTPLEDSIIQALNQPHDVWPAGAESRYYTYTTQDRTKALTNIYEMTLLTIAGGWVAQYPQAAIMLRHFLDNNGALYEIDMKKMMSEWNTANANRTKDMNSVMQAVEASATYANNTFRTISAIEHVLDENSNWGYSVNSYSVSIKCTYKKTAEDSFTMQVEYELHDAYNWDKDKPNMGIIPVSPRDMWELHHGGLAKNYEVYGKNTFTVTWTKGDSFDQGAIISNES